jgi:hypothetical protein
MQEELTENDFFTVAEVYQLTELVNETLRDVIYHYWLNKAEENNFEVLDWIELRCESGKNLMLTAGLETDGIKIVDINIQDEKKRLEEEFKGLVSIVSKSAAKHKHWADCLGKAITPSFVKHDGRALNDSFVLKFEDAHDIEIYLGLEGMEVEYFEED